ncbi:hypothetical protein [Aquabacterium sp.]|uniref:hypothetical protein n=1 Tax=Aquabacterium sp. TaxID=1872578 RepID=UPI00403803A8
MNTYEQRQATAEAAARVARLVASLGQAEGLWVATERVYEDSRTQHVDITLKDTQGIEWAIQAGTYADEGKVTIRLSSWVRDGISQSPKDSHKAACAYTRGAEAILKEYKRRALENAEAVAEGLAMLERQRSALGERGELLAQVKAVEALGVDFRGKVRPDATYQADGHIKLGQWDVRVQVSRTGGLTIHGPIYTTTDKLAAILVAINSAP